jgi:N-acetyl sugar amidotransferase
MEGKNIRRQQSTCNRCVLTTNDDPGIFFNLDGICNYCCSYDAEIKKLGSWSDRETNLLKKVIEIQKAGRSKKYDCILGLSGGVDSSYLALWAKESGLRPLVIHFDNGWNSELAVDNIHNICSKLDFDLNTYVINWEEFKRLQLAYLKAGVIDIEVLTDHAIMATIAKYAKQYGIRYTLNGFNLATEAIMPKGWVYDKTDWENIKAIYQQYESEHKLKSFPHVSFVQKLLNHWFFNLESLHVLNFLKYNKFEAKKIIAEKLNWRDYGGKHYESIFTKFYQAYILPVKFKVDKRRAHLSNLICSGQLSREAALQELEIPLYDPITLKEERTYVLKKLGITEAEFDELMRNPPRNHDEFKTEKPLWSWYFRIVKALKLKA